MPNFTWMYLRPFPHASSHSFIALAAVDGMHPTSFYNNSFLTQNASGLQDEGAKLESTGNGVTIAFMITAWVLLILGFAICCCAEFFCVTMWRGKQQAAASNDATTMHNAAAAGLELPQDRANHGDQTIEICRRCPPDYEVESLPSYTIVSGLPTYDDALEEFRKAGIILTPAMVPVIKIFESNNDPNAKDPAVAYTLVETGNNGNDNNSDNISLNSATCSCGGSGNSSSLPSYNAATAVAAASAAGATLTPQIIELSPDHLAALSQKRLSLQISFNSSVRRTSRSNAMRNHLLRSRAVGNTAGVGPIDTTMGLGDGVSTAGNGPARDNQLLPSIHRSTSALSLSTERQLLDQRLRHLHHRGSLY